MTRLLALVADDLIALLRAVAGDVTTLGASVAIAVAEAIVVASLIVRAAPGQVARLAACVTLAVVITLVLTGAVAG